jgi:hypothetical protein
MKEIFPPIPPPPAPTENLKEKKIRHLECVLQPTNWLHVFLVSKTVGQGGEIEQGRKNKRQVPQAPQKEKTGPVTSACWAFPLAAWNFYFQNCWPGLMAGSVIWARSNAVMSESLLTLSQLAYLFSSLETTKLLDNWRHMWSRNSGSKTRRSCASVLFYKIILWCGDP